MFEVIYSYKLMLKFDLWAWPPYDHWIIELDIVAKCPPFLSPVKPPGDPTILFEQREPYHVL